MKISRILIAAAILVSAGMLQAQNTPKNLVRNGQFLETKSKIAGVPDGKLPDPWYVQGGIKKLPEGCGVSTTEKPAGYQGNSYVITGRCLLTQSTLAVTPGKTYRTSCKVKTNGTAPTAVVRLQIIWLDKGWREIIKESVDKNGKKQKSWNHQWTWVRSAPEWKELSIPAFTAPANAKYAMIRFGNEHTAKGSSVFADFKMEEIPSGTADAAK